MKIALEEQIAETVAIYFRKTNTPPIRKTLPQKAKTIEEAIEDYKTTLFPSATSYGRTIWDTDNLPSIKVLEKNHFVMVEEFMEEGVSSKYFEFHR